MKTCTKCGEVKPTFEFHKKASRRDGLCSWCKRCVNGSNAEYLAATRENAKARQAAWRAAFPDRAKANLAAWRVANRERVVATGAAWYVANRETRKTATAAWRAANQEAGRIHGQNRRAREREAGGKLSKCLAERLFKLQRGKCACGCKQSLGTDYHLDHRMPLALGGANDDDNMQLLTATCNLQKSKKHPIDFMQQRGFLL